MADGAERRRAAGGTAALLVLTGVNLFNYLDRYIVAALVADISAPTPAGLGLSEAQAGWLGSSFVIVYLLTSPVFGSLADRRSRPRLIALGVAIWGIASSAGGLAGSFAVLLAARSIVGVGEAAYGTAAPAMLADYFPKDQRGRVFAIFYAAIPLGAALGYVLGGVVEQELGWRAAFVVAGVPGLALAALTWFLKDPPRGMNDPDLPEVAAAQATTVPLEETLRTYWLLLRNREYVFAVAGYAAYTFALGALAFWMPDYLEQSKGLSTEQATVHFGASFAVTGVLGTLLGGWVGDRLLRRTRQAYLWVCGISVLLAVPLVLVVVTASSPAVYFPAMIAAEVLLFMSTGPVNSAIINAVSPADRAKAMAASILSIHLLGNVPSPPLIGMIAEHGSLEDAMFMVPAALLVAAVIWLWAAATRGD